MNLTPIYELKSRLRAAAIAGTNLLSEDFRLKKAIEGFAPLAKSSPVFAKIDEMTNSLLADNSPANLLDTITLVDAVITTLGTVETKDEFSDLETIGGGEILEIPYSRLSAIIDALTTKGNGNYSTFNDIRENNPELLRDYRVRPALVTGMGASYSDLADEVTEVVEGMDSSMIPLLKMGFDPKGKKEMIRRIQAIETLGGASENAFYLEQLENSEKDIRRALIFALGHNVNNADKLIELIKTEKGKMKTAAMSTLTTLDCEKAAEFFEEYSKKKPVDVLELMDRGDASSKWASELTAKLIDRVLIDKGGNKITLSEAANGKVALKYCFSANGMISALLGKTGPAIEKIYREYDNKENLRNLIDEVFAHTIIITGDESLRKLAIELNNDSPMKGYYTYAEAIARFLGVEDCSKWLEEQVKEVYNNNTKNTLTDHYMDVTHSPIYKAARKICFADGKYCLVLTKSDYTTDKDMLFRSKPINQPVKEKFTDIFIAHPTVGSTTMLADKWLDISDKEYCEKLKDHFIKQGTINSETGSRSILLKLRKLNAVNVKGLAMKYLENRIGIVSLKTHDLQSLFIGLDGDDQYKLDEAREVVDAVRSGKLKIDIKAEDIDTFADWAERNYG